jgi:hypothetical protein
MGVATGMTLESWLKQEKSFQEQLKMMEGLCSALNEAHGRGSLHRGLDPAHIDVQGDGTCDLSGAQRGDSSSVASRYRAPETFDGAAHSPQADIYTAGVIFYEMLAGRSPSAGERTTPLGDVRPDVPRDLTDAIMGCLEKGPDWRPKDLSYLLQVVRTLRSSGAKVGGRPAARAAERPSAAPAAPRRGGGRAPAPSRSSTPLVLAALVLVVLAGGGVWLWMKQQGTGAPVASGPRPATPPPTTQPTAAPSTPATPVVLAPPAGKSPKPGREEAAPPTSEPPGRAEKLPAPAAVASATRPEAPRPTLAPTTTTAAETAAAAPAPTPTPAAATKAEELAAPAEPAVLQTISPLTIKRPSTTIFDVHGTGLRADLKATLLKIKDAPNGISILRQKLVNSTLVQIVVKVDEGTAPGLYGLSMADSRGGYSNTLSFTVAK